MVITNLLRQAITEEFQRQGEAGLIVWYDQNGSFTSVVESALPENAQILRFEGSYLALRLALEGQDPQFQGRWVIYVPEVPPQESWLRDWELLGTLWEMDLLELLHRKADLAITQRLTELLRRLPQNARGLVQTWEDLLGERALTEASLLDALLALGFGLPHWQMEQGLLVFLNGTVGRRELETRGLWSIFTERITAWTGWTEVPDDETALRQRLEAAILLSELVNFVPELVPRFSEVLPSQPRHAVVAHMAGVWRDREEFRDDYLQATQRVEREYEVGNALTISETLLGLESFPVVDDLWRRELSNAVAPDGSNFKEKVQRIGYIAEQRSKQFWVREGRASYWSPMALTAQLYQGCQQAVEEAESLSQIDEFVQHYAGEDGWWRLDLWALELAAKAHALSAEERTRFVRPAWRAYGEYLDRVNRCFAEAVQKEGWKPTQSGFWRQSVTGQQRTVVFLVDALGYHLAQHLKGLLPSDEFKTTLHPVKGVLPSITEAGMSALLPEAEAGLEVIAEAGGPRVRLKSEEVGNRSGRATWLTQRLGNRGKIVDLDEVERFSLEGVEVLVIPSREVDTFGTFAADLHPQGLLAMVEGIARAMSFLKDQGFERFLVTADHGFLFLPSEVQPKRIEAPAAKVCKHRFAISGRREGCIVKRAEEVGLSGPEIFAFPMGLSVFALQGETGAFLHGGLSLQECLVPVLEAKPVTPVEKVSVTIETPSQLTSRIALVIVRVKEPTLFAQPRRVLVEINGRRSEIVELSVQRQEATMKVPWLGFDETSPQEATIQLLDADSFQVLQKHTVAVEIVV